MKILILAYLLNGEPIEKTLFFHINNIKGFYILKETFTYGNPIKSKTFNCAVLLKTEIKNKAVFQAVEDCKSLTDRYNKEVWK